VDVAPDELCLRPNNSSPKGEEFGRGANSQEKEDWIHTVSHSPGTAEIPVLTFFKTSHLDFNSSRTTIKWPKKNAHNVGLA
jgi:hypothetical protein